MPKRLEWSKRAEDDRERLVDYYAETASVQIAEAAFDYIMDAVAGLSTRPVLHRPGKNGTRECVLKRFPYTIVYRASDNEIRIVRVMHQARRYFNR